MDSSLRERFAQLGPVRDVARVTSGTPAVFSLHLPQDRPVPKPVDAMVVLARRGLSMLRAKRAVEALLERGTLLVELPTVEDMSAVVHELGETGIQAQAAQLSKTLDVRALRNRLGLTREQFALRYGLEVETLKNWETGKREPDTAARSYLHVISADPERVEQAYARPSFGP